MASPNIVLEAPRIGALLKAALAGALTVDQIRDAQAVIDECDDVGTSDLQLFAHDHRHGTSVSLVRLPDGFSYDSSPSFRDLLMAYDAQTYELDRDDEWVALDAIGKIVDLRNVKVDAEAQTDD